jgi:hypothetical protein
MIHFLGMRALLKPILAKVGFKFRNCMPWDSRDLFMNV